MIKQATHPSPEKLSAFTLGRLPLHEAADVESHVSECRPCCETMLGLASDDTFVGLLKDAGRLSDAEGPRSGDRSVTADGQSGAPQPLTEHARYEILSLIGKGGMGEVYRARHRLMDRTVALKVIKQELVRKPEAVVRFHREVQTAARLSHPNIVPAFDAEQAGDLHFLAMEYVDGVNLSETVQDGGPLPIAAACDYIRQAALGLDYAHDRGMVHRDIKPHNLMLTADGAVKILDFGLASLARESEQQVDGVVSRSDLTALGSIMGTPDFIAPEQAEDARQADARSDIYSLGATLYFLLTGRPPFAEGSVLDKLDSLAHDEAESPDAVRKEIPTKLAAVVMKMLAKRPGDRYQSAAEVAEALKPFLPAAEAAAEQAPPQTQTAPRRWKPSLPALTAVAALFFAALFAGAVYYVQTDHGLIRVEVTDPSLMVTLKGQTITMTDGDATQLTVRPGEQTLIVRKDDADFEFETESFQIRRGDRIAFKVELVKGEIVVRKDGEPFERAQLLVGKWIASDHGDDQVHLTFNPNGTFKMEYFETEELVEFTATGKYTADFSVTPASLDLDASIVHHVLERQSEPASEDDGSAEAASAAETPPRERVEKHKFETIIEFTDANTIRTGNLEDDERPRTFGDRTIVWRRQGAKQNRSEAADKPSASNRPPAGERLGKADNAALVYWQAFALLPELSDEESKLLTDLEKGAKPGDEARSLLTRSKTALSLISQIQPDMPCRWELVEDGVNTVLPHLSKARMLARLLVLQAGADAESGKTQAAVDHLTQAFLVARNVDDGVLVQMIVGDSIESRAADAALALLPKLDSSSRERFAAALAKLPPRTTFTQAVRNERDIFGRGAGKLMSDALEQLGTEKDSPAVRAVLAGTEEKQAILVEELLAEYDKVIEASTLPLPEADKELARLEEEVQDSSNPLIQLMMPALVGTNQKHAIVDARIAELKTKLGVAAAGYKDPKPIWIKTDKRVEEVWPVLRKYYIEKYPEFAALTKEHAEADSDPAKLLQTRLRREIGELAMTSPVTEELQTSGSPVVLFMEGTQYLQKEAMITRIGLYRHPYKGASDEYCGILVARSRRRGVRPDETYPDVEPISADELRKLVGATDEEPASEPADECEAIRTAVRQYYIDKYPLFAAAARQRTDILSDPRKLLDAERQRQIGVLVGNAPVSEVINSFPGKPYVTFTEVTRASGNEVSVVCVNLYRNADGTCRYEVTQRQRKRLPDEPVAGSKPITAEEVRKLAAKVTTLAADKADAAGP
jgi:tRNA A-37 threonylcarbamoyl transferase component Bud32